MWLPQRATRTNLSKLVIVEDLPHFVNSALTTGLNKPLCIWSGSLLKSFTFRLQEARDVGFRTCSHKAELKQTYVPTVKAIMSSCCRRTNVVLLPFLDCRGNHSSLEDQLAPVLVEIFEVRGDGGHRHLANTLVLGKACLTSVWGNLRESGASFPFVLHQASPQGTLLCGGRDAPPAAALWPTMVFCERRCPVAI